MDIHNGLVLLGELLPLSPRSHPSFASDGATPDDDLLIS